METGAFIKRVRKQLDLSQPKFAAKIGVTVGSISQWESNAYKPSYEHYKRIIDLAKENNIAGAEDDEISTGAKLNVKHTALLTPEKAFKYHPRQSEELGETITLPKELIKDSNTYALTIKDNSMASHGIHQGDIAVINMNSTISINKIGAYLIAKKVELRKTDLDNGQIALTNDNPEKTIKLSNEIIFAGEITGLIRQYD